MEGKNINYLNTHPFVKSPAGQKKIQTNDCLKRKSSKNGKILLAQEFWKANLFCEVDQANEGTSSEVRNNGAATV